MSGEEWLVTACFIAFSAFMIGGALLVRRKIRQLRERIVGEEEK